MQSPALGFEINDTRSMASEGRTGNDKNSFLGHGRCCNLRNRSNGFIP